MKKKHIKVWPELLCYLPSVSPFQGISGSKHAIYFDFSGCRQASSTGLTVFLVRLLKYILQSEKKRAWEADNLTNNPIFETIVNLAFFYHLNRYCTNSSLLGFETNKRGPFKSVVHLSFYGRKVISFPIICLEFSKNRNNRREPIKNFRKMLKDVLTDMEIEYGFHKNQIISILTEMAKNSADHTDKDAYFGLDIVLNSDEKSAAIHFIFGDIGCGIKHHIEKHLSQDIRQTRSPHLSLYECYYYALKHGYTSIPQNEQNKGLGMSIILDGAKGINMELSVFDANSRGILSSLNNNITHEELRKHFYPFTKDWGFYYYGILEGKLI